MKINYPVSLTVIGFLSLCFTAIQDVSGKWSGYLKLTNRDSARLVYNFNVNKEKLSGSLEGPDGTVSFTDGSIKDSILSFHVMGGAEGDALHTGKYYGDSIILQVGIHEMAYVIKLVRVK